MTVRPVFVAPVSFGLGDLVVSLPVVQALVARGEPTWLVARSASQRRLAERIDGLAGCVDEDAFDPRRCGGSVVDLRDHPLQRDHWWGSREFEAAFGPLTINEILARIGADLGVDADFSHPVPLRANRRRDLRDVVVLVTETDGPAKLWPPGKWASLAALLDRDVRQVTRAGASPEMQATGIPEVCAPTPGDAVDVLSACRAVVGIDTGLTHVAVQQGTPTVTVCRHDSVYFRPWPHTRVLRGDVCTDECVAAEQARAYNERVSLRDFEWTPWSCPSGGRCLDATRPEQVVALLGELL